MWFKKRIFAAALTGVAVLVAAAGAMLAEDDRAAGSEFSAFMAGGPGGRYENFNVVVDISSRKLYARSGDEVLHAYDVAVGQSKHPTPQGGFSVQRIVWNPRWVPPDARWARKRHPEPPGDPDNPMGRVKIFFLPPDYYVHGTNEEDSLGQAESHGCIRMRNGEAIALARMIMANGGEAREPSWFRRVLNRMTHTQEVGLSRPVPFLVRG
jgi:murein L,D-transpeptidase YcbB/YkuD